jgi:hypothetical protein
MGVFTGGPNPTHPERFPRGEAVHFTEHAVDLGVPREAILLRNVSIESALVRLKLPTNDQT